MLGEAAKEDARRVRLTLTAKGRKVYQQLDARSRDEVGAMLAKLAAPEQERLVGALQTVEGVLEKKADREVTLRAHRPGDMGWVIGATAGSMPQEYGWDERFEALVAGIAAAFIKNFDKKRERCWIAEMDGEPVGCVFLVKQTKTVAKLRLLIVEPRARGIGLGRRLVEECIAFARAKGYSKLVLWTQSNLTAARAHLQVHRVQAGEHAAPPGLRHQADRRVLGASALAGSLRAVAHDPVAAFLLRLVQRAVGARGERVEGAAVLRDRRRCRCSPRRPRSRR